MKVAVSETLSYVLTIDLNSHEARALMALLQNKQGDGEEDTVTFSVRRDIFSALKQMGVQL